MNVGTKYGGCGDSAVEHEHESDAPGTALDIGADTQVNEFVVPSAIVVPATTPLPFTSPGKKLKVCVARVLIF